MVKYVVDYCYESFPIYISKYLPMIQGTYILYVETAAGICAIASGRISLA